MYAIAIALIVMSHAEEERDEEQLADEEAEAEGFELAEEQLEE